MNAKTMKAHYLVGPQRMQIEERPIPVPGPGEVRVKVAAVGICGSDVHYYLHGRIGNAVVQYPLLLGHEPSGVVDAVGEGVTLVPGTRVAIEPGASCLHCEHCRAGRFNLCPHVVFLGTPPNDGILAQYRVLPEHCCVPIPESLSLIEAALLEPFGVGLHAVHLARIEIGETVAIFGAGPIGIATLLAARLAGSGVVFMTDRIPERLAFARRMGADEVCDVDKEDPVAWIREKTNGRGVDVTFEAAGVQETFTHACLAARIGGKCLILGIPPVDNLTIPMHEVRRRELLMQHVRRSNGEAFRAMGLVAAGRVMLRPLATHLFPLERAEEAVKLAANYRDGVMRAIVTPNPELVEKDLSCDSGRS